MCITCAPLFEFYGKREHIAALPPLYGYFVGQENIQARLHCLKRHWAEQVKDEKRLKWQEITLCNTALFHSLEQLDRFAAALKKTLHNS